jgi:hypothetical protein
MNKEYLRPEDYLRRMQEGKEPARKIPDAKEASPSTVESRDQLATALSRGGPAEPATPSRKAVDASLQSIEYSDVQKLEMTKIQQSQTAALKRGILKDAVTLPPLEGAFNNRVVHIMPKWHHPTSVYPSEHINLTTTQKVVDVQKSLFLYMQTLKAHDSFLPISLETVAENSVYSIPRPPISLAVNGEDPIDVRSDKAQRILIKHDDALTDTLSTNEKISAHSIVGGIEFRPILPQRIIDLYKLLKESHTQEDFDIYSQISSYRAGHVRINPTAALKFTQLAENFEALEKAMNEAFTEGLLGTDDTEHVQQLLCGETHVRLVVESLRKAGATVIVSAVPNCQNWRDSKLPTETDIYQSIKDLLSQQ